MSDTLEDMKCWNELILSRELVSTPTTQPLISLDVLKLQSRIFPDVEETVEDPLFTLYCQAAEEQIESLAEIVLREKTYKLEMDAWAYSPYYADRLMIRFETRPIKSITHIKYYDINDAQQTLSTDYYESWLNHTPPLVLIERDNAPDLSSERTKRIECQYVAGHAGTIPYAAQLASCELVSFWFKHREAFGKLPEMSGEARVFWSLVHQLGWRLGVV